MRSLAFTLLTVIFLSGCATATGGFSNRIEVNTLPQGAEVYSGRKLLGVTPLVLEDKGVPYTSLAFKKQGYKPVVHIVDLDHSKKSSMGNLASGPAYLLTSGVDGILGSDVGYADAVITVELEPLE